MAIKQTCPLSVRKYWSGNTSHIHFNLCFFRVFFVCLFLFTNPSNNYSKIHKKQQQQKTQTSTAYCVKIKTDTFTAHHKCFVQYNNHLETSKNI